MNETREARDGSIPREFTGEELTEIIRRAASRRGSESSKNVSYEEMLAVGEELGIGREDLEAAAAEIGKGRRGRQKQARRKLEFFHHLASYVSVMAGLFLINLITNPSYWWFVFPAIGWGIGLGCHASAVYLSEKARAMGVEDFDPDRHRRGRHRRRRHYEHEQV